MSSLIAKNLQVGSDPTATNNFTIFQPATPDGTLRIGNGNTGITTSLLTINSAGAITQTAATANGVMFANGSKVLTSGSALTFDGTNFATTGSVTSAGLSDSGNLTFTGTGNRITGDFSNATIANKVLFQSSTTNGTTAVEFIPNGTSPSSSLVLGTNSDPTNAAFLQIFSGPTEGRFNAGGRGTFTYAPMTFYTGGSERVRIDTAGNVGIGTSSPTSKLTVTGTLAAGGIRIQDSDVNSAAPVLEIIGQRVDGNGSVSFAGRTLLARHQTNAAIAASVTLGGVLFGGNHTSSSASNILYSASITGLSEATFSSSTSMPTALLFLTGSTGISPDTANVAAGTERMRIDSSGNVGIGTSSPTTKLDVNGNIAGGSLNVFGTSTPANGINNVTTNALGFFTNSSERARIDSSGNVGIGMTPSGDSRFEVYGADAATIYKNVNTGTGSSDGFYVGMAKSSGTDGYVYNRESANVIFGTANAERARIDSSGNLLVGTTTASARTVISRADNEVVVRVTNSLSSGTTFDMFQILSAQAAGSTFYLERFYTSGGGASQFAVRADGVVFAQNTTIQSISDARVKENVRDSSDGLQTIIGLRPVRFDFKEGFGNNRKNQLGFIAQEVEAVFPYAIDAAGEKDENGDPYKSVGPGALIPVLVKAIQELKAEFDAYKLTHP